MNHIVRGMMDNRYDLPAVTGLAYHEGGAPALEFRAVFLESDSQAASHGRVVIQDLNAGFMPLRMVKIRGLHISKPGSPKSFNLGRRGEHENVVRHDEHAGQMKIRDDGFQVKIAEVPKIIVE